MAGDGLPGHRRSDPTALRTWAQRLERHHAESRVAPPGWLARLRGLHSLRVFDLYLPDEALVIRGGISTERSVTRSARRTHREIGLWAVSGAAGIDVDVETLVGVYPMPQASLRRTTVGSLRSVGCETVLSGTPGHCSILLPVKPDEPLTEGVVTALVSVLGERERNPSAEDAT